MILSNLSDFDSSNLGAGVYSKELSVIDLTKGSLPKKDYSKTGSTWECKKCTLINEESSEICIVCDSSKPHTAPPIRIDIFDSPQSPDKKGYEGMKILNQFPQRSETFHLKSVWRDPVHHQSIQAHLVRFLQLYLLSQIVAMS